MAGQPKDLAAAIGVPPTANPSASGAAARAPHAVGDSRWFEKRADVNASASLRAGGLRRRAACRRSKIR